VLEVLVTLPRRAYPTDLTDTQWRVLQPLIPPGLTGGRPARHTRRELVNAIAYWARSDCGWRLLPHDLPPWQTVYHYFRPGRHEGLWERILAVLREQERVCQGRDPRPAP
jgi:putative transposase